ncbi:MAG: hypothetical protein HN380_13810 [Victivallales bacterium]|nr:hypothetical protein [Victivallales bacterium]
MLARLPLLLVLFATQLLAIPLDIIPNGSFERDTNRDALPDGWQPAVYKSPGKAVWDDTIARTGKRSLLLKDSAADGAKDWDRQTTRWVLQGRAEVKPGQTVTAQAWLKSELTAGEARVTLAWFAERKWLHEDSSERAKGKQPWTLHSVTANAPDQAKYVSVYLSLNAAKGSVWFDDARAARGTKPPGNFRPIDLRPACNTSFRDDAASDGKGGWTDQGANDLRRIETGKQTLRGIPFQIVDSKDKSCVVLRGKGRKDVGNAATFPVNQTCDALYFLHACAWGGRLGSLVATYEITYADGTKVLAPLRNGNEVADWWKPGDLAACASGWEGTNAESDNIGLGIFPWVNPKPGKPIASVTARTTGRGANLMLVAVTAGDGSPSFPELPLDYRFTDTTGWYPWRFDVNNPKLGELDLSRFLDAPAGKHGFSSVGKDGGIVFADGTPGRFFGTNVGGSRCCPEKAAAEAWAERLAAYGVNLLRLHSYDSKWAGLIDYGKGNSRSLNAEALDRMDYFVNELKKRGIYVYFDLLDYRSFVPGDGVRDAAIMDTRWEDSVKGASIFNRRIIELQKEFATQLLTHRNPYTGLRYVEEPALLIQEITNENSLFYLANTKLILPSYTKELKGLWNQWLAKQYRTRAKLQAAWTSPDGFCALQATEDPAKGTVEMPTRHLYAKLKGDNKDPLKAPTRLNALTRFLYDLEVAYYTEMTAHLRMLGLKCLITGTNQDFSDAGNRANAACQAMTRNNYWCHPNVHAKPFNRFRNLSMLSSEIFRTATPIANVASSTVVGKPMIIPEFNFPWPNEFRAECLPVTMAYAALQEWDGVLFFAYETRPERNHISYFGNTADPVRWGQVPLAALMFHRGDVAPARNTIHVGVSAVDTFATRPRRSSDAYSPYDIVPYISKLRNAYFDEAYQGDADIVLSSGHSATGDYRKAKRAIVFADSAATDAAGTRFDRGQSARTALPGLKTQENAAGLTTIVPNSRLRRTQTISHQGASVGVVTDRLYLLPSASQLEPDRGRWLHRLLLDALNRWRLPGAAPVTEAGNVYRSDTGQLVLDSTKRQFTANAPRLRSVVGFLGDAPVQLGDIKITSRTPFAAITIISLDDAKDIASSRRLLVTAVARAENTGQATIQTKAVKKGLDADTGAFLPQSNIAIAQHGRAPVLAEPVDADITLPPIGPRPIRAYALNETGQKTHDLGFRIAGNRPLVNLRNARSPWILIER